MWVMVKGQRQEGLNLVGYLRSRFWVESHTCLPWAMLGESCSLSKLCFDQVITCYACAREGFQDSGRIELKCAFSTSFQTLASESAPAPANVGTNKIPETVEGRRVVVKDKLPMVNVGGVAQHSGYCDVQC